MKKKSPKKRLLMVIIALLIFITGGLLYYTKHEANRYGYKNIGNIPNAPVGLILGAGIHGEKPSVYLKDRLDKGIELYHRQKIGRILISGDNGNDQDDEVSVMKNYLLEQNVPEEKITVDTAGYTTYESLHRAKHVFQLDTITLVTQNYHLDRAVFIGRKLGLVCYGISADKSNYKNIRYNTFREYIAILKDWLKTLFSE